MTQPTPNAYFTRFIESESNGGFFSSPYVSLERLFTITAHAVPTDRFDGSSVSVNTIKMDPKTRELFMGGFSQLIDEQDSSQGLHK